MQLFYFVLIVSYHVGKHRRQTNRNRQSFSIHRCWTGLLYNNAQAAVLMSRQISYLLFLYEKCIRIYVPTYEYTVLAAI